MSGCDRCSRTALADREMAEVKQRLEGRLARFKSRIAPERAMQLIRSMATSSRDFDLLWLGMRELSIAGHEKAPSRSEAARS